jgi:predicted RNase H-like HicB family nuclease
MNNQHLWEEAEKLAARGYSIQILQDQLSDGSPIFVARNPELAGCLSQGRSREDALAQLDRARVDYIYSLLEDGVPVPEPLN